jgi:hypothetical protein
MLREPRAGISCRRVALCPDPGSGEDRSTDGGAMVCPALCVMRAQVKLRTHPTHGMLLRRGVAELRDRGRLCFKYNVLADHGWRRRAHGYLG